MKNMKSIKVGSSTIVNLNDSDDSAFLFKNSGQKRKLKPASPKVKRPKVASQLSKSAASSNQHLGKQPRKPPTNRSVPVITTKRTKKSSSTVVRNDESKLTPTDSASGVDCSKCITTASPRSGEGSNTALSVAAGSSNVSKIPSLGMLLPNEVGQQVEEKNIDLQRLVAPPGIDLAASTSVTDQEEVETTTDKEVDAFSEKRNSREKLDVINVKVKESRPNQQVALSRFFETKKTNIERKSDSFACPLCSKSFDNRFSYTSHIKQCAKKKKIPLAQLLQTVEAKEKKTESSSCSYTSKNTSARKSQDPEEKTESSETTYDLALAAALSLSVNKSSSLGPSSGVDRKVVDAQKATLEKFGFTSSAPVSGVGTRRVKTLRSQNSVLRSRTVEDRLRLVTEKAAVVLLVEENAMAQRDKEAPLQEKERVSKNQGLEDGGTQRASTSSQLPYQFQVPKLWQLGEMDGNDSYYHEDLRPYLSPSSQTRKFEENNPLSGETSATEIYRSPCAGDVVEGEACSSLAEDWGALVGHSAWSDASLQASDGQVPVHSLVLRVRCPGLDLTDLETPCRQATKSALLLVLRFIYTGTFGEIQRSDIEHVKQLGASFHRSDLIACLMARLTPNTDTSTDEVIPSSVSPKTQEKMTVSIGGGFTPSEPCVPKQVESSSKAAPVNNIDAEQLRAADEADTVPVADELADLAIDGDPSFQTYGEVQGADVVDLTQSGCASPGSCHSDPAERSYWSMVRRELDQELREEQEMEQDRREHAQELAKIQNFIDQRSSEIQDIADDREVDRREIEKIYNLSRSSNHPEVDLFADHEEVEVVPIPPKPSAEVIEVSSDSEHNNFDASTDEEVTPSVSTTKRHVDESFQIPIFESPGCDDFIDYQKTLDTTLASQSLVAAAVSPRTPRRVLASPVKSSTRAASSPPKTEELVTEGGSPATLPEPEAFSLSYPTTPISSSAEIVGSPEMRSRPVRVRRRSVPRKVGSRIVRRTVRSLNVRANRRSARSVIVTETASTLDEGTDVDKILSASVLDAMDESWRGDCPSPQQKLENIETTPTLPRRPFIEVTPCVTPSVRLVDKVTPRPEYSAMKTGSLKKHLQKFGLKRNLGKIKARKILRHIYEELHPVVNTRTGKFVKFLPDNQSATQASSRGGKPTNRGRGRKTASSARTKVTKKTAMENVAGPSGIRTRLQPGDGGCLKNTATGSAAMGKDNSDSESTVNSEISTETDEERDEFSGLEEEVLTQITTPTLSVDEAVSKYISENPELHRQILCYEPIWVEALRRELLTAYQVRYKLADIMDFLDRKCITFRSEVQSINSKKRNDRKKARCQKAKKNETASVSAHS